MKRTPDDSTGLRGSSRSVGLMLAGCVVMGGCADDGKIQEPRPLGEIPIEYPLHMWDQDMEGETVLRVLVGDMGGVDSVEVLGSSGHPAFDSAAVEGARQLRFTPARREDGDPIEVWAEVPVRFSKRPGPDTLGAP